MNTNIREKNAKTSSSLWWLVPLLIAVIAAALWFHLHPETVPVEPKQVLVKQKIVPSPEQESSGEQQAPAVKKQIPPIQLPKAPPPAPKPSPAEELRRELDKTVIDFFRYLDRKEYIKRLKLETDTYTIFKKTLKRLATRPPIPAGEDEDPKLLIKNLYHFFRVLGQKDIRLITEIMKNERDTMEHTLEMFYKWLTLGKRSSGPDDPRPSMKVLYLYSGFFLNTTGGRAYMFRRTTFYRLLSSYYAVLIVYKADRSGKNSYGIDMLPFIAPLRKEISRYPDFQFRDEYVDQLKRIERYYMHKR